MNKYLDIGREITEALDGRRPIVALESEIISHGASYPQNVETAINIEESIRECGAVPAMIAIIDGRLKCGLSRDEIDYLGRRGQEIVKCSRRDIPVVISKKLDASTTVAMTMIIASMAGVRIFATGSIGGVHRGGELTMDISADLEELARTPVMVVSSGAKAILDLGLTLEYLETKGVPVIGYGTDDFPAFYTRKSGFQVNYRLDTPKELAEAFEAQRGAGLHSGMLVANPIPEEYSIDYGHITKAIEEAVAEADGQGVQGKDVTPFLIEKIKKLTREVSPNAGTELLCHNARLAAKTAEELCKL